MDKIIAYRSYIKDVINQYGSHKSAYGDVENQMIFDTENDHYQLIHAGWHNEDRRYGCIIHMDIKNGKIWIQHDGTEVGMANELMKLGVPKDDIVLAFQSPSRRKYTGFAVT